ncbi:chondroitin sulfate N-acetylgalactosaminyltransferase 2-like [Mya arenaria]|uniref:chondroitin sulfate N-acetylgalactosaminyltransferase 2-like n=1 Tax=Mya arenaria TaxID=6604 RepID=UPI0022E880B6|nr:chondroitin sulfate N-acetylgalactosaminyltransferase 2-like [Mya arenaria]XP_052791216.1 chondroitin sulfate N-acetylgalactosaminyltransferase 2-like [Mya arenaria]XP_052791217.1 chondroitin sulfate N-acetylgalactosaminyltransferase 2-like [Mya arenaria]XP_052791218.1 chondroitin sulfate N-acetylgalactosaminyltransferase 2-like [Mya arenaria]XP_052791219.1 chondroitin sulfate N-acetylgalactosaminyltransferase 2-like [Mya arenaria]XP_052791220.1 chondroitin sulfate N-acetylgalactosaminyltra
MKKMYSRVSQQMPRVLFLLFSLSVMTMLYVAKFGVMMDAQFHDERNVEFSSKQPSEAGDEMHQKQNNVIQSLQERIRSLEGMLESTDQKAKSLTHQISNQSLLIRSLQEFRISSDTQKLSTATVKENDSLLDKIRNADILKGVSLKSEYELIPFTKFTLTKIFLVEPGLGRRVVEKPIGYKRKDILDVVSYAVEQMNRNRTAQMRKYAVEDFIEGMYRTEPLSGTQYELFFRDVENLQKYIYRKMTVVRPFGTLYNVEEHHKNTSSTWVNLILPLSGRLDAFQQFMSRFIKVVINQDRRVFLTVVYFGTEGLEDVKKLMTATAKEHRYRYMKLVTLKEEFSRGRGLQVGVLSWKNGDVILFLCDVDIVFTVDFLERCRVNTEQGRRVYFPIVFSLYNPSVVYSLQDMPIPPEREQLVISRNTGFWRDFGYGMTCQYRSDFKEMNGFDEYISGWGGEDVFLYQKYVKSDFMVIRATDPGIFHLWHAKSCDPKLNSEQYRSCIRSKALNEASHAQLGLLAFKEEIRVHKSLSGNESLKLSQMGSIEGPSLVRTRETYPPDR